MAERAGEFGSSTWKRGEWGFGFELKQRKVWRIEVVFDNSWNISSVRKRFLGFDDCHWNLWFVNCRYDRMVSNSTQIMEKISSEFMYSTQTHLRVPPFMNKVYYICTNPTWVGFVHMGLITSGVSVKTSIPSRLETDSIARKRYKSRTPAV